MNRETFLKDFKGRMKSEFEDFTTSSALISFPETLAESTGVNHVSIFNVLSYMEARFVLLESIDLAQKLLSRKLRLGDINFMVEYGRLPIVRKPESAQQETASARVGTRAAKIGRLLQKMAPLVRAILNDHPHRLNIYAYYLITSVFRGPTLERIVKQECVLLSIILENFVCNRRQAAFPVTLTWMSLTARKILKLNLTVLERLQLIAIAELTKTLTENKAWKPDEQIFELYFSTCPELLKEERRTGELTLRNGMVTISGANVLLVIKEQLHQLLIVLARALQDSKVSSEIGVTKALNASLKFTQHRIFKTIASTKDQHEIASVLQLQREKPLLPPCIYMLLDGLERNNKLSNIDRTYLIVYLMNIGLPLKETEKLLRHYYSKNVKLQDTWLTHRGGHLRRKYRNEKQHQYRCQKFDRYCVWQCGAGTRQALARIRRGQQRLSAPFCSPYVFNDLLNSLNKARNSDEARAFCSRLGCFENSDVGFYSPLGYYYNTKKRLNGTQLELENDQDFLW
ncbi:uncharacterized protein LOC111261511 isoform X2 [Varroa jacobsoni]|uniref:uncharacterized protein LOC111261511 isoform X2 n=1 Tax=Varroa jacobsoni TaxID=62625 RepID=UPI000BF3D6EE|nr:uncharacterized protein LOC111261511 isoform X2 [Varroa jacobsoni]XP_022690802.1 uncharacterized protein LOC111261511 isoform X2 [Varroa jacobsoni]